MYRKRDDSNIQVYNTIFSKYLTLPIATFPLSTYTVYTGISEKKKDEKKTIPSIFFLYLLHIIMYYTG